MSSTGAVALPAQSGHALLTRGIVALAAPATRAAADHTGEHDAAVEREASYAWAERGDPAGRFVADDKRRTACEGLDAHGRRPVFVDVGPADRRTPDLDQHLTWPRLWVGELLQT